MTRLFKTSMNYDFFANKQDKIEVLDFIFNATELQVFDLGSPYGKEINQYKSTTEIISHLELEKGRQSAVALNLWAPDFGGKILFRRVELNTKSITIWLYVKWAAMESYKVLKI